MTTFKIESDVYSEFVDYLKGPDYKEVINMVLKFLRDVEKGYFENMNITCDNFDPDHVRKRLVDALEECDCNFL